jgi:exodeoxyribonuclease VII large subunit
MSEQQATLTVSQLNRQVKRLLETHFDYLWVEGEVSNFARPASGHWYFSLKDADCQVRCAMFRNRNQRLREVPGNGDAVRLRARVSLYEGRGEFQLIVEHLETAGAGALRRAYDALREKLQAEGLFDESRKQALPTTPGHIGIITSASGAAIRDILVVLGRRFPSLSVDVLPVPVQGEDAAPAICAALERANRWQAAGVRHFDALIVGRGGGSIEDLWAFNEENVARAIAASDIPVVSAVGHEVDFTIADFVADARAATPSAAAEMLSPDGPAWRARFRQLEQRISRAAQRRLLETATRLEHLRRLLRHPGDRLQEQAQRLDLLEQDLRRGLESRMLLLQQQLALLESRLRGQSPVSALASHAAQLPHLRQRLSSAWSARIGAARQRLLSAENRLASLGPQATLKRGYAIVTDSGGSIVRDAGTLATGERVHTRLASGSFDSQVLDGD